MNNYHNLLTSTTLIPLWSKAVESFSCDPILMDHNAYPILQSFGYDLDYYDKKRQNASQVGCCLRAKWMDDETLKFVRQHPSCQVIQLGAGLDDRFRRIGMPPNVAHWYDLDLEEVAQMRREVIPETERNPIISMNMFDTTWMKMMKGNDLPTLILIEGVLMFIPEKDIPKLFESIAQHLGPCTVLFDSVPTFAVGKAKYYDSVKKYNKEVEYLWGINRPQEFEALCSPVRVSEFIYMSDLPKAYKFRRLLRYLYKIPFFYKNANQRLLKIRID